MEEVSDAIKAINQKFMAAVKRGDTAALAALYTGDARLLPPNHQPVSGTQAIKDFWETIIAMGVKEARLESAEVETRGDMAYEIGRYVLTFQLPGETAITELGKYVVVWKNQNDTWKLHIDIWNSSASAAG